MDRVGRFLEGAGPWARIWVLGWVLSLFSLFALWQTFFISPVLPIPEAFRPSLPSGVERVLIFSIDGLQASSFFESRTNNATPHLTSVMRGLKGGAVFGISDARGPTESRPGHRALFSGLLEDPSALLSLWETYRTPFVSVFNSAPSSLLIAYPAVVQMFPPEGNKTRRFEEEYSALSPNYKKSGFKDPELFLLDRFSAALKAKSLRPEDKTLLFLHSVGIDKAGHEHLPHTENYFAALSSVDSVVADAERLVGDYYGDNRTLCILTSDHGMTDAGHHGGSSASETETPFLVWGQGVKDGLTSGVRMNQIDIAPLIAAALNLPFPVTSEGQLRSVFWANATFALSALRANFRQVSLLLRTKKARLSLRIRTTTLFPFTHEPRLKACEAEAEEAAEAGNIPKALGILEECVGLSLAGVKYYEAYERRVLLSLAAATFLLAAILVALAVQDFDERETICLCLGPSHLFDLTLALILTNGMLGWELVRLPFLLIPISLSRLVLRAAQATRRRPPAPLRLLAQLTLIVFLGAQIQIRVFCGERWVESLCLVLVGGWILVRSRSWPLGQRLLSLLAFGTLAIFPTLPPTRKTVNTETRSLGPLVCGVFGVCWLWALGRGGGRRAEALLLFHLLLLFIAVRLLQWPTLVVTHLVGWVCLLLLPLAPFAPPSHRLLALFLALAAPVAFLSFGHEALFLPPLVLALTFTRKFELEADAGDSKRFWSLELELGAQNTLTPLPTAFRRAAFHLFFGSLSFFGLCDAESPVSFLRTSLGVESILGRKSGDAGRGLLCALKLACPLLLTHLLFQPLLRSPREVRRHFLIILLISQGLAFEALTRVENDGTWMEIGASVTPVVIVACAPFGIWLLTLLANILISHSTQTPPQAEQ